MPAPVPAAGAPCPCGRIDAKKKRPLAFAQCCGRYLGQFDTTPAPDAESLMRSRYCAYVLQDAPYLLATWHRDTRPSDVEPDPAIRWLGLDVRAHRQTNADHAEVEFVARYRVAGRAARIEERSRFVREEGRWFYVDGDVS